MRSIALGALALAALGVGGHGSLDASFGPDGMVLTPIRDGSTAQAIALQRDGKLDPGFGRSGMTLGPFRGFASAAALAFQPDGKIVVAGVAMPGGTLTSRWLGSTGTGSLIRAFVSPRI